MAWSFGDSFDLYATVADMANGYWDSGGTTNFTFPAGRFAGGQCLSVQSSASVPVLVKSSGVNDAVHHIVVAFRQTAAISGSTLGVYFSLVDGATAQCSIVFRSDGAIVLTSGGPAGTALATYTGAFPVTNTWYAFEFEIKIDNAAGSFAVRKNGNSVNDFSAAALDTQLSANAYANKLQYSMNSTVNSHQIDDLFWQSGAAAGAWLGDIRCYARMPASDQSIQFSRTSTGVLTQTVPASVSSNTAAPSNNVAYYTAFTAAYSGTVTGVSIAATAVGNAVSMKCAIHADNVAGTGPGAILASATAPVTPVIVGTHAFAFSPGVTIVKGTQYWVGVDGDGTINLQYAASTSTSAQGASSAMAYASFPQANPVVTVPAKQVQMMWTYTSTPANWQAVSEAQQDGLTSYVFDSNPGDQDFYGVSSIASTPTTVIAATIRAFMQKSDAGTRTAAVQLKSGATTVASPTLVLTTSGWLWAWRTDLVDPNTSAAWTPAAVNNAQIGPKVIA